MDKYSQLVKDLQKGDLSLKLIAIAVSAYFKDSEHLPEAIRNIVGGTGEFSGIVHQTFKTLENTIGALELAYRRGNQK